MLKVEGSNLSASVYVSNWVINWFLKHNQSYKSINFVLTQTATRSKLSACLCNVICKDCIVWDVLGHEQRANPHGNKFPWNYMKWPQNHPQRLCLMRTSFWSGHSDCEAPPVATMDGRRLWHWRMTSHLMISSVESTVKYKAWTSWNSTSSENKRKQIPSMPSDRVPHNLIIWFSINYSIQTNSTPPTLQIHIHSHPMSDM